MAMGCMCGAIGRDMKANGKRMLLTASANTIGQMDVSTGANGKTISWMARASCYTKMVEYLLGPLKAI